VTVSGFGGGNALCGGSKTGRIEREFVEWFEVLERVERRKEDFAGDDSTLGESC
jgi:hypothetical protein